MAAASFVCPDIKIVCFKSLTFGPPIVTNTTTGSLVWKEETMTDMTAQASLLDTIHDFLAHKRIAMIGMSREPQSFSLALFKELSNRGYDLVPVNPHTPELLGCPCYGRVQDIKPPVDGALLLTSPEVTETVVSDCAEAGIRRIWMHRAGGKGAVSEKAVQFCRAQGLEVVPGECALMFLPRSGPIHRVHGFIRKLTGRYPKSAQTIAG
jgi:uncharacterized protein